MKGETFPDHLMCESSDAEIDSLNQNWNEKEIIIQTYILNTKCNWNLIQRSPFVQL